MKRGRAEKESSQQPISRGNGRRIITSAGRVIAKSKCFKHI
jgi:hypothetical protein